MPSRFRQFSQNPSPIAGFALSMRMVASKNDRSNVIETNVYCYSTPKFKLLTEKRHPGGRKRGRQIFEYLVRCIDPKVLILHGIKVRERFRIEFGVEIPEFPSDPNRGGGVPLKTRRLFKKEVQIETQKLTVFVIPSLSAPACNHWGSWADGYLDQLAKNVKRFVR
jgi:hypothetical protein